MKNTVLSFAVVAATVLGLNALVMADFTITDTFTRPSSTDLGTTEAPGQIFNWYESKPDNDQDVYLESTFGIMECMGFSTACADINGLNLDIFVQTVDISFDFSMVGTGEAIIEYLKGSNGYPFQAATYFVGIHPSGVIYLKRNDSGNMVNLARVENLTLNKTWTPAEYDNLRIHIEMTSPGVVQSIVYLNNTQIINYTDSSFNARAFGTVGFSSYGGWVTNVVYDNLLISAIENNLPSFCGDTNHPYPVGDLTEDCYVDLADLALMSANWLDCTDPNAPCSYNP